MAHTKIYQLWHNMMSRCYAPSFHSSHPTYINCSVVDDWKDFQIFSNWCNDHYNSILMKGWNMDKDLLVKNNNIYGPDTVCFIPKEINMALKTNVGNPNKYSSGITFIRGYFRVRIGKGKRVYCGNFKTLELANQRYKEAKEQYLKELADKYKDVLLSKVYNALLNYKF